MAWEELLCSTMLIDVSVHLSVRVTLQICPLELGRPSLQKTYLALAQVQQ